MKNPTFSRFTHCKSVFSFALNNFISAFFACIFFIYTRFEIAPIRALTNAHQLLGGEAFARMLSLLAGAWQGTPNSLRASMLSGMALFVKTYEGDLSDRTFIRRMSAVSPEEIIRLGRIETDVGLRFARIILDKYNGGGAELPYRFKR